MIPANYTSYIRPVVCPYAWTKIREKAEIPYVVSPHKDFYPFEEDQECFFFKHPSRELDKYKLFNRFVSNKFVFNSTNVIQGFMGYFRAVLFEDIKDNVSLSIRPFDHTENMASWFPLFFPIKVTKIFIDYLGSN